ncbi:hypothetical protein FGO68_gene9583 [Halteria grandinella]|uniref:Uncharacterized protein n=1 Tax=Halteria grandinella TaxID=5974 RepID=A0A8J8NHT0_HALGN|nr:hypothetical protein FGO68_gene9583 [Halteria grandinella]
MNKQQREVCQVILKKCLRKWKQYLRLKEFNRSQKSKAFECYRKQCKVKILRVFGCFHTQLHKKQLMNIELHKIYLKNLLQRSLQGFQINVVINNNKRQQLIYLNKRKYQLVDKFLLEIYVQKPFKILDSYRRERQIKKQLDDKAKMIYKINKQRKYSILQLDQ